MKLTPMLFPSDEAETPKPSDPPANPGEDSSVSQMERIAGQIEAILTRLEQNPGLELPEKRELVFVASVLIQSLSHCHAAENRSFRDADGLTRRIIDLEAVRQVSDVLADRLAMRNACF